MRISEIIQRTYRQFCNKIFKSDRPLTIVTGASEEYFQTLTDNLLDSISTYEPNAKVIVWDLGLSDTQCTELKIRFPEATILRFPFADYPAHYALSAQSYAWKSAAIYKSLNLSRTDLLFWLDAGCKLKGHLNAVRHLIHRHGFYSPYSSTTIQELTSPLVIEEFESICSKDVPNKRMLSGGIVGVKISSPFARRLIWEWYQLSKLSGLIVPNGSNRSNHRQDQSLLSLIYYCSRKQVPLLAQRVFDFLLHQR